MSVLLQIAISLVVAEERLEFEHRDLHVGNALVLESSDDLEWVCVLVALLCNLCAVCSRLY